MSIEDGYVLSTRQAATSEAYWEFVFAHRWSSIHDIDPFGGTVAMLTYQQAGQSTGWLVCESCIQLFDVNRAVAKEYARSAASSPSPGGYCPPGGGPVNPQEVALACAKAWKKLYGSWPSSIQRIQ